MFCIIYNYFMYSLTKLDTYIILYACLLGTLCITTSYVCILCTLCIKYYRKEKKKPLSIRNIASFSLIDSEWCTISNLTNGGYQYPIPVSEIECIGRTGIVFSDGSDVMIKQLRIQNSYVGLGFSCIIDTSIMFSCSH